MVAVQPLPDGQMPGSGIFARTKVRAEIRRRLELVDEVALPELTLDIVEWVKESESLVDTFLDEMLRPIVYKVVQQEVARTRGTEDELLPQGDKVQRRTVAEIRGFLSKRFERWREHVGGNHKLLLNMDSDDLLSAAEEREQRADTELLLARLWRSLAQELPEGDTVGIRFTPQAIAARYEQIKARHQQGPPKRSK